MRQIILYRTDTQVSQIVPGLINVSQLKHLGINLSDLKLAKLYNERTYELPNCLFKKPVKKQV